MPSLQALSQRLKSVTSTARLTKTMKVVASVKLKVAQRTMEAARPFGASTSVLADVLTPGEEDEAPESKLIVPITSDRGLCGGVNSYIIKDVKKFHAENPENASTLIIGSKGVPGLGRTHGELISTSIDETYQQPVSFSLASFLAEQILASPQQEYTILYNKFRSVINFEPTPIVIKGPEALGASGVLDEFEFEGEKEEVRDRLPRPTLPAPPASAHNPLPPPSSEPPAHPSRPGARRHVPVQPGDDDLRVPPREHHVRAGVADDGDGQRLEQRRRGDLEAHAAVQPPAPGGDHH